MRTRLSIIACCASLFLAAPAAAGTANLPSRPNVIVVLADDLGYGDLGCYNAKSQVPTPRIDGLAAEGMRFSDAHSPSSVCSPTRYGLLTGRYAWRSRLKSGVLNGYSPALIEPGRATIASLLGKQGYATACIGKWHLGLGSAEPADYGAALEPGPGAAGFAESFVLPASLDMPPYVFVENGRPTVAPSETIAASKMRRYGGEGFWREGKIAPGFRHVDTLPTLAEQAEQFLKRQTAERPFFLYLPLTGPHTPWMPTAAFRGRSRAGYYGDFVAQVDATVGRLLDVLSERKLAQNTLVILTSDNGAHWLASDIGQWNHRANGELRGMKADLWEGGHRVPFIVRWPEVVRAGSQSDQLVCLTDVLATVAEIVGKELPDGAGEDSLSFACALTDGATTHPTRESVVHHSSDGTFAIRQGPWKLAAKLGSHGFSEPKHLDPKPGDPAGQLYNLVDDPGETRNRWLDEPRIVARLSALLANYQSVGYSRPRKAE